MNFMLLCIMKKLFKQRCTFLKLCLASCFGGAGALLTVMFPEIPILLRFLLLYVVISGIMVFIAFSYEGLVKMIKNIVCLYIVAFCVSGFIEFLYYSTVVRTFLEEVKQRTTYHNLSIKFMLFASITLVLFLFAFMEFFLELRQNGKTLVPVTLGYGGKTVEGMGLYDTGNRLRDPITHKPVAIVDYNLIKSLFSEEEQNYIRDYPQSAEAGSYLIRIFLIPYHSVGNSNGLLPGVILENLMINKNHKKKENMDAMVAIYPENLSSGGDYQIILHEEYFR